MAFPDFFRAFRRWTSPFPTDVVGTQAIRSDQRAWWSSSPSTSDMDAADACKHGAQWGSVIEGEITFTIGDETRVYRPGDSYSIPGRCPAWRPDQGGDAGRRRLPGSGPLPFARLRPVPPAALLQNPSRILARRRRQHQDAIAFSGHFLATISA
jgi:hypothetical protein